MSEQNGGDIQIGPHTQSAQARADFAARWGRVMDCVNLKQPDRMPIGLFATFWFAKYGGLSFRDMMYDYDKVKEVTEKVCLDLQPDLYTPSMMTATFAPPMEAMNFKQLEWPGHGVSNDRPFQYVDQEYMTAEEYDDFLFDPTGFYLQKYLPRVCGAFDGIQGISSVTGSMYVTSCFAAAGFGDPNLQAAIQRLGQASGVMFNHFGQHADMVMRMTALGFPGSFGSITVSPYDAVADFFRGATGMMKDLYRHRDKLLAVLDKMSVLIIRSALAQAKMANNPVVFIPVHWAGDAFMSQKQFETFWWPSFHKLMMALIDAGLIPMPMWEADCTKRLEFLREHTPPGKCIYWFERTDMVKAHEILGDIVALRGGMPGTLMINGTPEEVDQEVRRLTENVFHKGGRLILDGAFGLPDEAKEENVRAMFAAARKYAG